MSKIQFMDYLISIGILHALRFIDALSIVTGLLVSYATYQASHSPSLTVLAFLTPYAFIWTGLYVYFIMRWRRSN